MKQFWLEGHLDILIKVKTDKEPAYINPSVETLGQLINNGAVTVHVRPYGRTYDSNEIIQIGGIGVVDLSNTVDSNNTTGQYRVDFDNGGSGAFIVGEEIRTSNGKRGIITESDSGATGQISYILKSDQFADDETITGFVSGKSADINAPYSIENLVAGYGTNIRVMVITRRFMGGATSGEFIVGEIITQSVSGATGYILEDSGGTLYVEDLSGTFDGTNQLTGNISGATNTPTSTMIYTTVPKDIGGGVGDKNYTAVVSANITDANPRPICEVYEWFKWLTRKESTLLQGGIGSEIGIEGRIFRRLDDLFAEVRSASPYGLKAGALVQGAQGVFIEKETLHLDDIRSIQLKDNDGNVYDPPNLQVMKMTNLFSGVRGAVYRSTGDGSKDILRNEFKIGTVGSGNNQSGDSTILVAANSRGVSPLPNDIPDLGILRILDPNGTGNYLRFIYDGVDKLTNIFTLKQGIGQNTIGDVTGSVDLIIDYNAHVVFLEEEAGDVYISNLVQYDEDVYLYAVARIKGKKPFETTSVFGGTGASIGAVLEPDEVVNLP
jgi:hypothetical protein